MSDILALFVLILLFAASCEENGLAVSIDGEQHQIILFEREAKDETD